MEQLKNDATINSFILTLDVVNKALVDEKVVLYGKLFANTCVGEENINFDEYQEWMYSLSDLSKREIYLLLNLYEYEVEYNSNKGWGDISKYWDDFIESTKKSFNLSTEEIYSLLERLLRTGFYYNNSNTCGALGEKYKKGHTTNYFKKFAQRICDE